MAHERPLVYLHVEGGIGAKKTTFLERIGPRLASRLAGDLVIVPEPIEAWRNVGGFNLLEHFYAEPARYALTFQTHAMSTRVAAVRDAIAACIAGAPDDVADKPIYVLCERSVYTDRHVFVEMLHRAGLLSGMERAAYLAAYDYFVPHAYQSTHAGIIYLRTDPRACADRIRTRGRPEEASMAPEYLEALHAAHTEALAAPDAWGGAALLDVDAEALGDMLHDDAAADALAARVLAFIESIIAPADTAAAPV